eukprot:GCRY01003165.1.p1 GENE.GCRY01003165.1~~GCRY01003165.1.p1  ORF type:complete len:405 (+),score=81.93 GCRY01003165.1:236-1450(+)
MKRKAVNSAGLTLFQNLNILILRRGSEMGLVQEKLFKKNVLRFGGNVCTSLAQSPTHIVTFLSFEDVLILLEIPELEPSIKLVSAQWLIQCCAEQTHVDERFFSLQPKSVENTVVPLEPAPKDTPSEEGQWKVRLQLSPSPPLSPPECQPKCAEDPHTGLMLPLPPTPPTPPLPELCSVSPTASPLLIRRGISPSSNVLPSPDVPLPPSSSASASASPVRPTAARSLNIPLLKARENTIRKEISRVIAEDEAQSALLLVGKTEESRTSDAEAEPNPHRPLSFVEGCSCYCVYTSAEGVMASCPGLLHSVQSSRTGNIYYKCSHCRHWDYPKNYYPERVDYVCADQAPARPAPREAFACHTQSPKKNRNLNSHLTEPLEALKGVCVPGAGGDRGDHNYHVSIAWF